jgi:hypothetical protein
MKRAKSLEILRTALAQLDVLAHNADDVSLLLEGVRKIAWIRHAELVCRKTESSAKANLM